MLVLETSCRLVVEWLVEVAMGRWVTLEENIYAVLHGSPPFDCLGRLQVAAVAHGLHGRHRLACKDFPRAP